MLASAFGAAASDWLVWEKPQIAAQQLNIATHRCGLHCVDIVTAAELGAQKRRMYVMLAAIVLVVVGLLIAAYFFLPPLDLLIAKARVGLFR